MSVSVSQMLGKSLFVFVTRLIGYYLIYVIILLVLGSTFSLINIVLNSLAHKSLLTPLAVPLGEGPEGGITA